MWKVFRAARFPTGQEKQKRWRPTKVWWSRGGGRSREVAADDERSALLISRLGCCCCRRRNDLIIHVDWAFMARWRSVVNQAPRRSPTSRARFSRVIKLWERTDIFSLSAFTFDLNAWIFRDAVCTVLLVYHTEMAKICHIIYWLWREADGKTDFLLLPKREKSRREEFFFTF